MDKFDEILEVLQLNIIEKRKEGKLRLAREIRMVFDSAIETSAKLEDDEWAEFEDSLGEIA